MQSLIAPLVIHKIQTWVNPGGIQGPYPHSQNVLRPRLPVPERHAVRSRRPGSLRPVHPGKCGNDFLLAPGTKKSLILFQRNEGISEASEVMLHSVAERSQDADPAPIPLPGTCLLVTPAARSALLQGSNRRRCDRRCHALKKDVVRLLRDDDRRKYGSTPTRCHHCAVAFASHKQHPLWSGPSSTVIGEGVKRCHSEASFSSILGSKIMPLSSTVSC